MLRDLRTEDRWCFPWALLRKPSWCSWLLCALVGIGSWGACCAADQQTYVLGATFNGGSGGPITVAAGSEIAVSVMVQVVGATGLSSWWCSTEYEFYCPDTQVRERGCVQGPSPSGGCYCNWGCLGASSEWVSSFTTHFTIMAPATPGAYDVTLCAVTQEDTCGSAECSYPETFADAVTVTCGSGDTPSVDAGLPAVLTCAEPSGTLTATVSGGVAPYTYLWTPGGSTSQNIIVTEPGTYTVQVTGGNGCSTTDSVVVTQDKAALVVEAGDPQVLSCAVPSVTLTANATGGTAPYSFLWTPGNLTTQSIAVTLPGTYTVDVTGGNGCSASDAVVVSGIGQWTELLSNGGFEQGLDGWRLYPAASGPAVTAFAAIAPSDPPASETACLQTGTTYVQGYAADSSSTTTLVQDVTALLQSGRMYRLSGWIWSEEADSANPVIALHYVAADGTMPADGAAVEVGLPASRTPDQWTYCQSGEFLYQMPADCTQAWIVLGLADSIGYGWWDDISLEELAQ